MTTGKSLHIPLAGMVLAIAISASGPLMAQSTPDAGLGELVADLRQGGHVIFIRHGETETDYADQVDAVMGDCSTQRTLSENGWHQARRIGAAFDLYGIPVGDVISSEYCRAWQTADLAFDRYDKTADLNFAPAEDFTDEQIAGMREGITPYLSRIPDGNANTVLVGHDDVFEAATGIYPEPQGVTFVLRPEGDGSFEVLGSIPPDGWSKLTD